MLLIDLPETNEYDKANQRYAANNNKSWQDPSLRLLGSKAVEDVAESSQLTLISHVGENRSDSSEHYRYISGKTERVLAALGSLVPTDEIPFSVYPSKRLTVEYPDELITDPKFRVPRDLPC